MADQPAAETTTEVTAPGATSTGGQPEGDWKSLADEYKRQAEDYKSRFNGMQGKYQQELEKWNGTNTELSTAKATLEAQLQNVTGEREGFEAQFKAAQTNLEQAQSELQTTKAQHDRLRLLTAKFSDLLPYEYGGPNNTSLLPEGTGEALETQLSAFQKMLGEQGKNNALKALEGVTPPAVPKEGGEPSVDEAWGNVLKAMGTDAYDETYSKWVDLKQSA